MSAAALGPVPKGTGHPSSGLLELGRQLIDQKQYRDAMLALQRMLRLRPEDAEARRLLATCLLRTGEPGRAADVLEPARLDGTVDAGTCREVGAALSEADPERSRLWLAGPADPAGDRARQKARHRRTAPRWWRVPAVR